VEKLLNYIASTSSNLNFTNVTVDMYVPHCCWLYQTSSQEVVGDAAQGPAVVVTLSGSMPGVCGYTITSSISQLLAKQLLVIMKPTKQESMTMSSQRLRPIRACCGSIRQSRADSREIPKFIECDD